ncbi:AbrB/MazE/SpoVT family DNA-binding domain-containing protein [Latilactobacillus fuchuensis]|uniref:SpoVT-AbrB domain-containing protein n=1 Tax=Latilactobacillus fuchuensis DSM 14340 = JCM 11249 TaxID=1423747 RepID=A0A0R1S023_9LACO|nr:AbrB/MazE/SpoVT family DNA-binding domain-containing protein [Latilactobacillus fuchuensis]KRL60018.1 hypothetical protein FC69_GL001364 [Latilactobacillus fuchuensis DSM 14340 = JCM 11249]
MDIPKNSPTFEFHDSRKITQIGSSYGVTLPKELLHQHGFNKGDQVDIQIKITKHTDNPFSKEFTDAVNTTFQQYNGTFNDLKEFDQDNH